MMLESYKCTAKGCSGRAVLDKDGREYVCSKCGYRYSALQVRQIVREYERRQNEFSRKV